jgi:hypothetical protein
MVILEKIRKKYQIWTNNDEEILVTTFDYRLKGEMGTVLHLNRTGPYSHYQCGADNPRRICCSPKILHR